MFITSCISMAPFLEFGLLHLISQKKSKRNLRSGIILSLSCFFTQPLSSFTKR